MTSNNSIDDVLRAAVTEGHLPNVAAVVAGVDDILYEGAVGSITADSRLRVMSMTKTVTVVAALQLAESGDLDFGAPVGDYCPDFDKLEVLEGFKGDEPVMRPPRSRATVAQLASNTSGLSYGSHNADIARWERFVGMPSPLTGSAEIFKTPLVADPGTRVEYGLSADWLGRVIEVASGQKLDAYAKEKITTPLGMRETAFLLEPEKLKDAVPIHMRDGDGRWSRTDFELSQTPEYISGGGGLYSTPRDFMRFQQMLLGGGTLAGIEILAKSTVDSMFSNQVGDLFFPELVASTSPLLSEDIAFGPGNKWGLGLMLNTVSRPGMRAAGTGSWAGAANTYFWVDPVNAVTAALYTQALPFLASPIPQVYEAFEKSVYDLVRTTSWTATSR